MAREDRVVWGIGACYAAVWAASAIRPLYPADWLLENLLVLVGVPILVAARRRLPFGRAEWGLLAAFLSLHAAGAHYTYEKVPLGFWMRDAWGLSRNHYDRLVHLSFGLFCLAPLVRLVGAAARPGRAATIALSVLVVGALSAWFELVEWIVAASTHPELGTAYLGAQGDEWDAQKDMACAWIGAALASAAAAGSRSRGGVSASGS